MEIQVEAWARQRTKKAERRRAGGIVMCPGGSWCLPWQPTIRKVRKLTALGEYDGWIMVNLYPQITSHPQELHESANKELMESNLDNLKQLQKQYRIDAVWPAWGDAIDNRSYLGEALVIIQDILDGDFQWFYRGRLTRRGNPRHPLYMKEQEDFNWFPVYDYAAYYK